MANEMDYEVPHYCPVYDKKIEADVCYESLMCLNGMFKVESVHELSAVKDIESARHTCKNCEYSKL